MYNEQLKTFICVADCGSFAKAAEKLFISSTAVMKQMNMLEKELGIKLFSRTNHGIRLTSAGESIYKDAKYIISYAQKAVQKALKIEQSEKYTIRVGTSMLNPCKAFMDLWNRVNDDFPQFRISVITFEDNHEEILSVIDSIGKSFDFLVGACDSLEWLKRCNFYKLGEYRICCAVPIKHRLASKKLLNINDLYGETIMMVKRGDSPINDSVRDEIEQHHKEIYIEDTPHFYDIDVFNRCEQENCVLSTIECWKDIHPSLVTIPINWDFKIPYGLLYSMNPSEEVLRFLKEADKIKNTVA